MTLTDFQAILPQIITVAGAIIVMLMAAAKRSHAGSHGITLVTLIAAIVSLFSVAQVAPQEVTGLLIMDNFTIFFSALLLVAATVVTLISYPYFNGLKDNYDEYYILLLLSVFGALILVSSNHFVSLFLGLEVMTIAFYGMIAYLRNQSRAMEAAVKYFVLASATSAFLLFGMALVYLEAGSMQFAQMGAAFAEMDAISPLLMGGLAMMIIGIGFKLSVFPLHLWTPDVYQGAPAPVTAFLGTVSKGAAMALFLRFFIEINGHAFTGVIATISIIAIGSMLIGNLLALLQSNVKRILAYSSITHVGYMLVALLAGEHIGAEGVTFYLLAYVMTTLASFSIVSMLSTYEKESEEVVHYRGLFWRKPWIAASFTTVLLSLAGIPLTAGFLGKYYIMAAGVNSDLWTLLVVVVIASVIGLFYYLRIVVAMFSEQEKNIEVPTPRFSFGNGLALTIVTLLIVWNGVYPTFLIDFIQTAVGSLY